MDQRRPHDCCADSHSRCTLLCYWDRTDGISLCLDVDLTDSAVRTRNGFVVVAVAAADVVAVEAVVEGDDL